MIGELPTSIKLGESSHRIRTDYRDCLTILTAFNDIELTNTEKVAVLLECLYVEPDKISEECVQEAIDKAVWFLDCGDECSKFNNSKPLYDWNQDEQMIFSSINKVAGREVRTLDYLHWWTFIGLFNEIGEGAFSTIVSIRYKKNTGKKLDKAEQEFYRKNRDIIELKRKYTLEEQAELDALNELLRQ